MDTSLFIGLITQWITKMFPSTEEYAAYIGPGVMMFFTILGIFTNLLPEPGHKFPIPDTVALEAELKGNGKFILRIAMFTRSLSIGINWFLGTAIYSGFYKGTNLISGVLSKVKLAPKPAVSTTTDVSDTTK